MSRSDSPVASASYNFERTEYESALKNPVEWRNAVAKGWGYDLYQQLVEFPADVIASLRNNIPPPKNTLQSVREYRQTPANRLEQIRVRKPQIRQQIKDLERELSNIEEESKYHLTKLRGFDAVLSPVRRLPYDVVREIARYTLSEHPRASVSQSPLNLCQTSSAWRSAALSLPELWTTLQTVVRLDGSAAPWQRGSRRVMAFIERAQDLPLSLYLFFKGDEKPPGGEKEEQALQCFANTLSKISGRVTRLGFGGQPLYCVWTSFNLEAPKWDLNQLEHLHFLDAGARLVWSRNVPNSLVRWASKPVSFSFTGPFMKDIDEVSMSWRFLTQVRFTEDLMYEDVQLLFDACINLRVAEFRVEMENNMVLQPVRSSEKLEDLAICTIGPASSVATLLSRFRLPSLQTLRLSSEKGVTLSPAHPGVFAGFTQLRRLFVDDSWKEQPLYMIRLLRECTTLEELCLASCPRAFTPVLEAMTWPAATSSSATNIKISYLLPQLRTLQAQVTPITMLERSFEDAITMVPHHFEAMARMVGSRRPSRVPDDCQALRQVVVYADSDWMRPSDGSPLLADLDAYLERALSSSMAEGMELRCMNAHSTLERSWFSHAFDTWPGCSFR